MGCQTQTGGGFNARSGVVSRNHQIEGDALRPDSIRQDSKFQNFYMSDHLVFLGQDDTARYALTVTLGRGLADNRFKRSERDFTGFLFDGKGWTTLPYTRMKQDLMRLDVNYPYLFGGLNWTKPYTDGEFSYDRHDFKFALTFSDLKPVQSFRDDGTRVRNHAIGQGTLTLPGIEIRGTVYYELMVLEGYNPLANVTKGITYTNYDWLVAMSSSGKQLICSSDSTTPNDRIKKNFLALQTAEGLRYADGSDQVRVVSDELVRDPKINELLALKKTIVAPELGVDASLKLTEQRVFLTNGFCLSLVDGALSVDGAAENVWGIVEHKQQPKSDAGVLK